MCLIKNKDTFFDDFFVSVTKVVIEEIIIGHKKEITNGFDEGRIVVRTKVVIFSKLFNFLGRDYFVFEFRSGKLQYRSFIGIICTHHILNFSLLILVHVLKLLIRA